MRYDIAPAFKNFLFNISAYLGGIEARDRLIRHGRQPSYASNES